MMPEIFIMGEYFLSLRQNPTIFSSTFLPFSSPYRQHFLDAAVFNYSDIPDACTTNRHP
jgi:hypothetical protein